MFALGALGVASLLRVAIGLYYSAELSLAPEDSPFDPEDMSLAGVAYALSALSYFAIFLISAICFWIWFYRAYVYLKHINEFPTERAPWWTVVGFIIPFISLVVPYRMMAEIWDRLEAEWFTHPEWETSLTKPTNFVLLWWLAFLGSNAITLIANVFYGDSGPTEYVLVHELRTALQAETFVWSCKVLALIPAILMVRNIMRLYTPLLTASIQAAAPPPPPAFAPVSPIAVEPPPATDSRSVESAQAPLLTPPPEPS